MHLCPRGGRLLPVRERFADTPDIQNLHHALRAGLPSAKDDAEQVAVRIGDGGAPNLEKGLRGSDTHHPGGERFALASQMGRLHNLAHTPNLATAGR